MKDLLLIAVRKFLEKRVAPGKSILLGYSGGPDSKALLYLLMECRRFFSFKLHLAHVDHGWREESGREAVEIQKEADRLEVPLHLLRLEPKDFSAGNLEEQGRDHRLRFFFSLYDRLECQALALGHHADDQAEIVLKRVFEGASLFNLSGLSSVSQLYPARGIYHARSGCVDLSASRSLDSTIGEVACTRGMQVWRPLLKISKKKVLDWLSQRSLSYFLDPTNASKNFLRGRMREQMLPLLQESFGKEVSSNLCRLAEDSRDLKEYFSALNRPILFTVLEKSDGSALDLNPFLPLPDLQLKYLFVEWMRDERAVFSRQIMDATVAAVSKRGLKKKFSSGASEIEIDNGLILLKTRKKQLF